MNKKGQAAMEFLMTYGWAILVVLAAIGALAYFGVLSPDRFLPSKCTIAAGFSCTEYKVTSTGLDMRVQNNLGSDASYVQVNLAGKGANSGCTGTQTFTGAGNSTVNGDDVGGGLINFACAVSGTKFSGDISIVYIQSGQTVNHTVTGTIVSNVE